MPNFGLDVFCKCNNCGYVEFIEQQVCSLYDEELPNPIIISEAPAPKSKVKFQYICARCGELLIRGNRKRNE
jgi:hypothetical protein